MLRLILTTAASCGLACSSAVKVPDTLPRPDRPETRNVTANHLTFAYLELGTGPLVLVVHGFPDTPYSHVPTLRLLAEHGFRAVAPFTRGYAPTQVPAGGDYSDEARGADLLALADELQRPGTRFDIIGHDWGASAAFEAARQAPPRRVRRLVGVAVPHAAMVAIHPVALWRARHFFALSLPTGEWTARHGDFTYIRTLYDRWSGPDWNVSDEQLSDVRDALSAEGSLGAALGYYRFTLRQQLSGGVTCDRCIQAPALLIAGAVDGALKPGTFHDAHKVFADLRGVVFIPEAGHFVHQEAPKDYHRVLLEFLKER